MFLANYTELNFNVDIDCRAYSFNSTRTATVYDDLKNIRNSCYRYTYAIVNDIDYDNAVLFKHDSI
jgi:hypothetical protein